jgi:hypothetical protein
MIADHGVLRSIVSLAVEIAASLLGLMIHMICSMPCAEASIVANATRDAIA